MYTKHAHNILKTKIINFINLVGYKNGKDVGKAKGDKTINIVECLESYK